VLFSFEEQENGVATPLDHSGAEVVGAREELGEAGVENLVHLLGADLALAGEPLGQIGEAGDVYEGKRARDLLVTRSRVIAEPLDRQPRNVRDHSRRIQHRGSRSRALGGRGD